MNRLFKYVLIAVGLLVVAAAVVMVVVVSNLDRIIKHVVETTGSDATGAAVTLEAVDVSIRSGEGSMSGFTIANPPGFASPHAFRLDSIKLGLELESLGSEIVVVEELLVDGAHLVYERNATTSNLDTLLQNVGRYSGGDDTDETETRMVIRTFKLTNGEVTLRSELLPEELTVEIPELTVRDIGERSGGATVTEVAKQLLQPVLERTKNIAENRLRQELDAAKAEAQRELENAVEQQKQKALQELKNRLSGD